MIHRMMIAAAVAGTAAAAQPPSAPPAPPASAQAPDEARRAAGRRLVDASMPPGWIEQLVRAVGTQAGFGEGEVDPELARRDRHFAERKRLTDAALASEALRVLNREEPELRAVTADFFARRLSLEDLEAASRFYSSPAGRRLMSGALAQVSDPDYLAAVRYEITPLNAALMERVSRRFTEEAAGLPPFPGAEERAVPVRVEMGVLPAPRVAPRRVAAAPEPERLAAAQRALEVMWTPDLLGVPVNLDPVLDAVLAMPMSAFGFPIPPDWQIGPQETVAELLGRYDPAYRERIRIVMRVWAEETNRLNAETAPIYKRIMADFYGRTFTVAELDAFTQFFASPAGAHLTQASTGMYDDPQFVAYLVRLAPRLLSEIGPVFARIQAATAHLPPPRAPRRRPRRR